ncbi:MAG: inositol monophosphatase [Acidobacteria bacterium]|nr:inositol monophosphatase [Acidobacteriota bacterium]
MSPAYIETAVKIAAQAGDLALHYFRQGVEVRKKGKIDLVTEADVAVEEQIVSELREEFPGHGLLREEGEAENLAEEFVWVVDPIDGTTNFAHGYPMFCVSIGLRRQGREVAGVVYAPVLQEMFWAAEGEGAWLNGRRIRVSEVAKLEDGMLCTGFPYDVHRHYEDVLGDLERVLPAAQAVRRDGSAALNLCYVAAGRFDGFWERRLHPWDTAAARVVVTEAGGRVSRFDGGPYSIFDGEILASNGRIHDQMIRILVR